MSSDYHIAIIASSISKNPNEVAQSFIFDEAYRLAKRGFEIHIVRAEVEKDSIAYGMYFHGIEKSVDFQVLNLIIRAKVYLHYPLDLLLENPIRIYREGLYALYISKVINKYNIDLVHAHFAYSEGWCALLAKLASNSKIPFVITVHGYDINVLPEYGYGIRLNPRLDTKVRTALRHADCVIAVSKDLASKVEELGAKNVIYVPNGVDTRMFNPLVSVIEKEKVEDFKRKWGVEDADITIGFFRHLRPWYGAHYIPLIARLVTKNTNAKVKFVLAGDADPKYMKLLYELILRLDLRASVIYIGKIPRTQMPLAYQAVDIVINTSLIDGMPPSTLEAMASGKPVVSYASGGNKELIIDKYNGFLIQVGNYRDFALKLLYLVENPSELKKMGLNGRRLAEEKFDIEKRIDKIINIYKTLIER